MAIAEAPNPRKGIRVVITETLDDIPVEGRLTHCAFFRETGGTWSISWDIDGDVRFCIDASRSFGDIAALEE